LQTDRPALWFEQFSCRFVTALLLFSGYVVHSALAADAADEARTINQQVLVLIKRSNFTLAEILAKKGLLLCNDVGDVKVFCASQFNESLGDIAFPQAEYSSALAYFEQALQIRQSGLDSGNLLINRSLLRVGRAYLALQRTAEAEDFVGRAVLGFEKLSVSAELGTALSYLRNIYVGTDRLGEATTAASRELKVYEAIGDGKAISNAKLNLSAVQVRQAQSLVGKNKYLDAEKLLVQAIKSIDPPPPGGEKAFSALQAQLGNVYERQRRYAEAEPFMLRAIEYRTRIADPGDTEMPTMLSNLASLYSNLGRPADTIPYAVRAVSWFDENKQEKPALGFVLLQLARAQRQLGHLAEAETAFLRAKDVLDCVLPETEPLRVNVRIEIGTLRTDQERFGEAEQVLQSALEAEQKLTRPATGWRSSVLAYLGLVYREQGRYPDAERLLLEAVKLEEAGETDGRSFWDQN
jgi:tetratricopeptide (TPR) repeat protein